MGGQLLTAVGRQTMKEGFSATGSWRVLHESANKVEHGVRLISKPRVTREPSSAMSSFMCFSDLDGTLVELMQFT